MTEEHKFYLEIAKIAITSVLVVLGWVVVHLLHRKSASDQELRKELRSKLDGIHEDIRQLRQDCITYYLSETPSPDLPIVIKVLADDIREQAIALSRTIMTRDELNLVYNILSDLVGSATGGAFETKNRKPISIYDPKLSAIFNHGAKLATTLDRAFQIKYQQ